MDSFLGFVLVSADLFFPLEGFSCSRSCFVRPCGFAGPRASWIFPSRAGTLLQFWIPPVFVTTFSIDASPSLPVDACPDLKHQFLR
jgi:hypothetical protein